jgi:hypothetical protein
VISYWYVVDEEVLRTVIFQFSCREIQHAVVSTDIWIFELLTSIELSAFNNAILFQSWYYLSPSVGWPVFSKTVFYFGKYPEIR